MSDMESEYRGWRVVEGPGSESSDQDVAPDERDLGKEPVLGAGYGASTGGVDGEPGYPGAAPGEIPEHTGPIPIAGTELLYPSDESE